MGLLKDAELKVILKNGGVGGAWDNAHAPAKKEAAPPLATGPVGAAAKRLLDTLTSDERKQYPIAAGFLDYFPDAVAAVSNVSWIGNEKHNPGEPMHHARGKSMDHPDCVMRHLAQRGGFDEVKIGNVTHRVRHTAAMAWRAMAMLQEELERELGLTTPRGATELPER